ncbi:MAG: TetR/AcrR family transcriptional regulator [Actinobacteria bacterium]|nr:TetR/AcrR family transcriptional regulator [Actinomycetota bacterium]MBU1945085.1 TetR/AcrR family transcriptional regulator [Actinomycetota bacterium]MBU2688354.1 TetR/AcrR family transcriptional regulator [Actinomycetota bacterium]
MARKLTSQKRADLLNASIKIFKAKGFRDATVKDIVTEAGASTATFYRYFKTKDDVYSQIFTAFLVGYGEIWSSLYTSMSGPVKSKEEVLQVAAESFRAVLAYYRDNRDLAKIVFRHIVPVDERFVDQTEALVETTFAQLEEAIEEMRRSGLGRRIEPRVGSALIVGAVYGVSMLCIVDDRRDDVDSIVDQLMEIVENGLTHSH